VSFVNLPPAIGALFKDLSTRIQKLENVNRFFATVYPILPDPQPAVTGTVAGDIDDPKVGQIWLNTTSNQLRICRQERRLQNNHLGLVEPVV
jgi:hypothetical protein